jgi:microcystin-dependent protein
VGFLDKPIGEMDLEELTRLIRQTVIKEIPPIPAQLTLLGDEDTPLLRPEGLVAGAEALVYDQETGQWTNSLITAESFAAEIIFAERVIIIGDPEARHIRIGEAEHEGVMMTGIHSFEADGMTVNFMLDSMSGDIYLKGSVQFGNSYLHEDNMIELQSQAAADLQEPSRVQSTAQASTSSSAASCTWTQATARGNLLVCALLIYDADGTVPTPNNPASGDWTLAESQVDTVNDSALYVWYADDASPRNAGEAESITLNDTVRYIMTLYEYSGLQTLDSTSDDNGADEHPVTAITTVDSNTHILGFAGFGNEIPGDVAAGTYRGAPELDPDETDGGWDEMRFDALTSGSVRSCLSSFETTRVVQSTYSLDCENNLYGSGGDTGNDFSARWIAINVAFTQKGGGITGISPATQFKAKMFSIDLGGGETQTFTLSDIGHIRQSGGPTGAIMQWPTNTPPPGALICDGSSLLRADYPALFEVIGTTYGSADADHFNIPDYEGRVLVGLDSAQTEFDTINESGGAKTHTLTAAQMPVHDHAAGELEFQAFTQANTSAAGGATRVTSFSSTADGGDIQAQVTKSTADAGSGQSHNNLQPYRVVHHIILV